MITINFFHATATVIPTQLIGVVFTGKLMDNWKLELEEKTSRAERKGRIAEYVGGITFVGWLLLAYSDRVIEGSPQNSVTAVPVDRATPIPLK